MVRIFKANLAHYPVMPSNKVRRVIIVTYFRAGSNFVGDLLSSSPPTFYHYEPFRIYGVATRLDGRTATNATSLLGHLLRCELQSAEQYVRKVFQKNYLFTRNHFLWTMCRGDSRVCFWPDFVSKQPGPGHICEDSPSGARPSRQFWLRGGYWTGATSRRAASTRTHSAQELRADLNTTEELEETYPNSTYRVRFEDVSMDPKKRALELFETLGLNHTVHVTSFLKEHTKARKKDASDPYSTRKEFVRRPFSVGE
ncbi:hypothetical protein MTO96_041558 [Rhipicephalus appendiculatus]